MYVLSPPHLQLHKRVPCMHNMLLQRKCTTLILKTQDVLSDHTASTRRTKPTEILCVRTNIDTTSLRKITRKELHVEKQILGRGMFGRCYLARLGPLQVCVKVFRREKQYVSTFAMEALLLSKLCHENIPWLHGIVSENTVPKMIIQSFHGINGKGCSLHKVLCSSCITDAEVSYELHSCQRHPSQ